MFSEAVLLAKDLEDFTRTFLDLDKYSQGKWRVMETSMTDVLIAHFVNAKIANVKTDGSIEATTGADLEILLNFPGGRQIVYVIQAKRSEPSSSRNLGYSFKHIYHKPKKAIEHQVQTLYKYCRTMNALQSIWHIPLYAFYHSDTAASTLGCSGIMVTHAGHVLKSLNAKGRNKLECGFHQENAFCFHKAFLFARNLAYSPQQNLSTSQAGSARKFAPLALHDQFEELTSQWLNFEGPFMEHRASAKRLVIYLDQD